MDIKKALVVDDSKVAHLTLRKLLLERLGRVGRRLY